MRGVPKFYSRKDPTFWKPVCFVEVVNKVGALAMPINFVGSRVSYGPGAAIGSLIDP